MADRIGTSAHNSPKSQEIPIGQSGPVADRIAKVSDRAHGTGPLVAQQDFGARMQHCASVRTAAPIVSAELRHTAATDGVFASASDG